MAARPKKKRQSVRFLYWRPSGIAYYQRTHVRLVDKATRPKGRVFFSLETRDRDVAEARVSAVNLLFDRGDWDVIQRLATGKLDVKTLQQAVTDGELRSLRRLHRDGLPLQTTANEYLARVGATLGRRTHEKYAGIIAGAVAHFGADKRLHEVSTADAEKYLHALDEKTGETRWSPRTQASHRNTLGALWKFAMEREHEEAERCGATVSLTSNPWRRAKAPRLRRTRFSYLNPAEARVLLETSAEKHPTTRALLATAIFAGLRLSELANLRTDLDVLLTDDPATSWIIIQGRDGEHAWEPKTERSSRRLRPVPALHAILCEHRRRYAGERYFFPPDGADVPANLSTIRRWVIEAFGSAGIRYGRKGEALTLHSLRHTYVTWQVAAGIPIPTVAKRAGDSPAVILAVYAHAMPEQDQEADLVLQRHATGQEQEARGTKGGEK